MGTVATILVVVGLIFGGLTGTVAAAQDDLPGQVLYQFKLLSEGTKLDLTLDPMKKMELDLQLAMRRLDEIKELQKEGIEPPYSSFARFENHLQNAIGQIEEIDPEEVPGALIRIREMLQACLNQMDPKFDEPLQSRLRTMIQERISWLDECIKNPDCTQERIREGWDAMPSFRDKIRENEMIREQDRLREQTQTKSTENSGKGPGYQTPGPGNATPEPGYQTPGPGYQTPGPGYQTPGPGYQTPGPGYQTPGPGYQTPGPGYQTPGPGYQTPGPGYQTPGSGGGGEAGKKP